MVVFLNFNFFFECEPFLKSLLILLQYCFCFMLCFFFGYKACGVLAPWPGIKPTPPALKGDVLTGLPGKPHDIHNFRTMVAIHQPSNQFSHSFNNYSNFLEQSVEIQKRWNCHFRKTCSLLDLNDLPLWNIRTLEWSATVWAHSHPQLPLKSLSLLVTVALASSCGSLDPSMAGSSGFHHPLGWKP